MSTQPKDIATNRQRAPKTYYVVASASPDDVVVAVADEYENVTGLFSVAPRTLEVGFDLDTSVVGEEKIVPVFNGPVCVDVSARIVGGTVTQDTTLALLVDADFSGAVALAFAPLDQRDIAGQEVAAGLRQLLRVRFFIENVNGSGTTTNITPTHFQVGLSSSVADTVSVVNASMSIERIPNAGNFA